VSKSSHFPLVRRKYVCSTFQSSGAWRESHTGHRIFQFLHGFSRGHAVA
jgi:hypothetical protein